MDDLRSKAKAARESGLYHKIMVITDGIFSMDGDIAKLPEIVATLEPDWPLYVPGRATLLLRLCQKAIR